MAGCRTSSPGADGSLPSATDAARPDGGLSDHLGRPDAHVVGLVPVTPETLKQGRGSCVVKHGVGADNIDIQSLHKDPPAGL